MPLSANDVALIQNASEGNLDEVRRLLYAGANVNAQLDEGITALIIASSKGHVDVVRLLLQQSGVEVNARAENGATALVVASLAGYDDVVRELLRHSEVDVNIFTFEDGVTALHHASAKNQKKSSRCCSRRMSYW